LINKKYFATGCVLCALAVASGALGAHGLRNVLEPYSLDVYKTAVLYHFLHAFGMILISLAGGITSNKYLRISFWCLLTGIILFSGSLYILSTQSLWSDSSLSWLGPVTPIGGLFFIVGWIMAAISVFQKK
jgi:uncharacterized membrane protein YgdD (TMEM256/DUF423 family)